jgi:hypothetical protein
MINPKNSSSPAIKSAIEKMPNEENPVLQKPNISSINRRNFFQSNSNNIYSHNSTHSSQIQKQQAQSTISKPKDYFINEEKNYKITYRDVRNPWLTSQTEFTDSLYNLNKIGDNKNDSKENQFKSNQYSNKFDYWEKDDEDDDDEEEEENDNNYQNNYRSKRVEVEEEDLCSKLRKYSTETNNNLKQIKGNLPPERAEFELASTTNYFNRNFPSSNKSQNQKGEQENDDDEEEEDFDDEDDVESNNIDDEDDEEDDEEEDEDEDDEETDEDSKNSSSVNENPTDNIAGNIFI